MAKRPGEQLAGAVAPDRAQDVVGLSCITLRSPTPGAWSSIGRDVLGAEVAEESQSVSLAFASGKQLRFVDDDGCPSVRISWAVSSVGALHRVLERASGAEEPATEFADPDGVVSDFVEVAHRSLGAQPELGHLVLGVADVEAATAFYTDFLDLRVSDRVAIPLREGGSSLGAFLRAGDRRHHSLALITAEPGLRHVMVELADVDAVGRALDACSNAAIDTSRTLGRHTNDHMLSFYFRGPDGYDVEVGCCGTLVDETSWVTGVHDRPSEWGHKFVNRVVPQTEGSTT